MRPWHRRWRHSIRWRLVILFLLLAAAIAAVFLVGTQRLMQGGWQGYAKPLLADYADRLAVDIGSPPDIARVQALVARLPLSVQIDGPLLQYRSHPERAHWEPDDNDEERWGLQRHTADGHVLTFSLAALPPSARPRAFGWVTLAILLGLTALAYRSVRRLMAPLQEIGAGAERFGRGQFDSPIAVRRDDELGELAGRINLMADNLHGMLDAKRALLLAISHELRSPLTRARINAELLDETPERAALIRDLSVMRDLVSDLIEGERLAIGHAALQPEDTDVPALVRDVVASFFDGRLVRVVLGNDLGPIRLDPARVRLLLRNLIGNAFQHAGNATVAPVVSARRDGDSLLLSVRDHGPGVAPEALDRLADAFYRPDSARSRAAGGVGLGLYLCRLVAEAHGGSLTVRNAEPGLEVTARLRPAT